MRVLAMSLVVLFATVILGCGGEDSPRLLNINEDYDTETDLIPDDKDSNAVEDTEKADFETEDSMKSSDLANSGMWSCLICDDEE